MAETNLPPGVACYFDTVAKQDSAAFGQCFVDDAEILDVDRPIKGRDAIVRWANDEVLGGTYTVLEVTPSASGAEVLLTFVPPGESSGFKARYAVTLSGGKIARMVLKYA